MKKTATGVLAVLLLAGSAAGAAEFWEKKKYTEWSEKECRTLLENSPWAQHKVADSEVSRDPSGNLDSQESGRVRVQSAAEANEDRNKALADLGPQGRQTERGYNVQIRSAAPLRQAWVRRNQLLLKYDQMTPEQKQNYDRKTENYLSAKFPDTVVIYVEYWSTAESDLAEMSQYWGKQTTESLKKSTFLNGSGGVKAPLLQYAAGQGGMHAFQFVFSRTVDGRPVVGLEDEILQVEFVHPSIQNRGEKPVLVEFKLKSMQLDGQLVY